jgi:O-antigen ligase
MILFDREKTQKKIAMIIDWLLLGLVFLVPLYFAFFHEIYSIFVVDKVVLLRVGIAIAALLFVGKIFLAGQIGFRLNRFYFYLAGLLILLWLLAASFTDIKAFGFWGYYPRQQGFFTTICYLLFAALLVFNLDGFVQARRYIKAMLLASFLACVYGLLQYFNLDPIKWGEGGRIFSTFGQPNFFGHFLIIVIPFTVFGIFFLARRLLSRSLLAILLLGQLACLLFTYSRSAWIGMAAELFLAVLIWLVLRQRKKMAIGLIILVLAGAIYSSTFFSFSPHPAVADYTLRSRISTLFDFSQGTVRVRLDTWSAAIAEFKEESAWRKIIGYGQDSLYEPFSHHYQPGWSLDENTDSWPDRAHDLFFDIILTYGLLGLAAYLSVFIVLVRQVIIFLKKSPHDQYFWLGVTCVVAIAGYLFNNLFSFSDTPQYLYFYLVWGLLIFVLTRTQPVTELKIRLTVFSRTVIFAAFSLLVLIFIIFFNIKMLLADYYYMEAAKNLKFNNDCEAALAENTKAISWGAGNSLYYQGGYFTNGLSCMNQLAADQQEKLKDNLVFYLKSLPVDKLFFYAQCKTDVDVLLSGFDKAYIPVAESSFVSLARKYPEISIIYSGWADFELSLGNNDQAIAVAKQGLATLPLAEMSKRGPFSHRSTIESWQIGFDDLIGKALVGKKDDEQAIGYFSEIIKINPYYFLAYKELADIYQQRQDFDRALWYNKRGLMLNPSNSSWAMSIGLIYKEKGDGKSALEYFNQVLALDPKNKDAQNLINSLKPSSK